MYLIRMYLFLLLGLMIEPSNGIVGDIEGVVSRRRVGVGPTLHHEGVAAPAHHVDLRDQQPVYVPRYAPANVT